MKKAVGIILFRKNNSKGQSEFEYLLLRHYGKYWNFPKGQIEVGEESDELKTAFRETEEEVGIKKEQIKLNKNFREAYIYTFKSDYQEDYGQIVTKQAVFYLGEVSPTVKIKISYEHKEFGWFNCEMALKKLNYNNKEEKKLLKKAHRLLKENSFKK